LRPQGFGFQKLDIVERKPMADLRDRSSNGQPSGGAGRRRYSIENPSAYTDANIVGFLHILEGCRHSRVGHLVFASSSSVYGANTRLPFSEHDNVDHPVSLYAATKKANELMAHSYSSLYGLPCTGLRFFTVYGLGVRHGVIRSEGTAGRNPVFNRAHGARFHLRTTSSGIVRVIGQPAAPAAGQSRIRDELCS
jgi:UDP-glucuronate 4-epimerase